MSRLLGAVAAACLVAVSLLTLLVFAIAVSGEPSFFAYNPQMTVRLFGTTLFGILILVLRMIFPPLLLLAIIGRSLSWHSLWIYVLGGALIGAGSGWIFADRDFSLGLDQHLFLVFSPVGVICGWIYWRIVSGRTADNGHAIDPP